MNPSYEPPIPSGFGWRPSPPDQRDFRASSILAVREEARPRQVDLRQEFPPVFDQGPIGSCVSQSLAALVYQARRKHEWNVAIPSRPFIYYGAREIEGTIPIDAGCYIRSAMKVLDHHGAAPDYIWENEVEPNDISHPSTWLFPKTSRWIRTPTQRVKAEARRWQTLAYYRVISLAEMLDCLADGFAFVIGFTVYENFYDSRGRPRSDVPLPDRTDKALGGHAVTVIGYNEETRRFIIRNSWGTDVQTAGHFTMGFDHLTDPWLAGDAWTIREVERHGHRNDE